MTATQQSTESYDVVVIGAGQAGLAVGYFLARQRKRFLIVDAADSVGAAWRARWDSLLLFTPRRYDSLPGLAFRGDRDGYPTADGGAGYRVPGNVPQGTVLLVGGGNTGYQIAAELSSTHNVYLAVGGRQAPLPQRLLGRDLFWWLVTTRLIKTTIHSRLGQKLSQRDT